MSPNTILLLMFGSLTLFMLSGLPIAFVLGGLSLLFIVTLWEPSAVIVLVLQIYDTMKSEALLAIPLFILMACILQRSGVIEDLYKAMELWFGRLRGGLAIVSHSQWLVDDDNEIRKCRVGRNLCLDGLLCFVTRQWWNDIHLDRNALQLTLDLLSLLFRQRVDLVPELDNRRAVLALLCDTRQLLQHHRTLLLPRRRRAVTDVNQYICVGDAL